MTPNLEMRQSLVAFESELTQLINKYCIEHLSDTPDFIIARHLMACLYILNTTVENRENWYDRKKEKSK